MNVFVQKLRDVLGVGAERTEQNFGFTRSKPIRDEPNVFSASNGECFYVQPNRNPTGLSRTNTPVSNAVKATRGPVLLRGTKVNRTNYL